LNYHFLKFGFTKNVQNIQLIFALFLPEIRFYDILSLVFN